MSLENCNEKMEKDTDKYSTDAEESKDIQLLVTGNKLRKALKVSIAKIETLEAEIQNLEKKRLKYCLPVERCYLFHNFVYFLKIIFA